MSGKLFIISTPIGNLEDMSARTKRVLSEVDWLLVEDTRVTIKLLNHLGINKRMVSCHKFNEAARRDLLKEASEAGESVALVSDAGTPLISDPGSRIVEEALSVGMNVIAVPGPTACIQALVASGLPCERFVFEGFLPDKESLLRKRLEELKSNERTLVFYLSPHGVSKTVSLMCEVLGDRRACLARELTKKFEEYMRLTLSQLVDKLNQAQPKGEFTLVVEGRVGSEEEAQYDLDSIRDYITGRLSDGGRTKEIANELVETYGMRKSAAYDLVVNEQDKRQLETT